MVSFMQPPFEFCFSVINVLFTVLAVCCTGCWQCAVHGQQLGHAQGSGQQDHAYLASSFMFSTTTSSWFVLMKLQPHEPHLHRRRPRHAPRVYMIALNAGKTDRACAAQLAQWPSLQNNQHSSCYVCRNGGSNTFSAAILRLMKQLRVLC